MRLAIPAVLLIFAGSCLAAAQVPDVANATIDVYCTRIIDGDTLQLQGGETVRLLGIDTPELGEPYANDAKWLLYDFVAHKPLRLELDEQERDIYNRLLAHVYVETDDGWVLVNAAIVRAGLANLLFIPPNNRYRDYFEDALEEARLNRRGIWGDIEGCLTIAELEDDLVSCVNEMVTVQFTVAGVDESSHYVTLHAAEGEYGFYLRIPIDFVPEISDAPPVDWIGECVLATGIVGCERVGRGPSIILEYPEQVQIPCEIPPSEDAE